MKFWNMKKGFLILIIIQLLTLSVVHAQKYGNEWINFAQKYYKLSTAEDGIYRVSYSELQASGFPVSTVDPRKIQLFHRGVEHAIHIEGQNDSRFDPNDYIEFYGKRNDGTLDEELYITPEAQPHKYYNIYSDTTAYFLTWSLSKTGKRIQPFKENNVQNLPAESYHFSEQIDVQTSNYSAGAYYPIGGSSTTHLTVFDRGEGWTGAWFKQGQSRDIIFTGLDNNVTSGPAPILKILLTGRNNLDHDITIEVGPDQNGLRLLKGVNFSHYSDTLIVENLQWADMASGSMLCRVNVVNNGRADRISVSYAKLTFPDALNQGMLVQKFYNIKPTNGNRSYFEIQNVPSGTKLFDITDETNLEDIGYNVNGSTINAVIKNGQIGKKLLLTSTRIQVPEIKQTSMRNIFPSTANYLMITHRSLRKPTKNFTDVPKAYADYRASAEGGGFDTLLLDMNQLYNMFSYGEKTSLAIYRFARFMAENGRPEYIFLMGKGLTPNYNFHRKDFNSQTYKDLIPTGGYPGNDIIFVAGLNGSTYEPGISIGRISANSPENLEAYFEKVKETESLPFNALWRKELVNLSGGRDLFQQQLFRRYVDGFKSVAEGIFLGGDVTTLSKKSTSPTELINIADEVNAGKLLVTFFGHSAPGSADIDIGYVSEPGFGYNNQGKYPMMIVNGCNAGDMFNTGYGFGEDWMVTPDKGAVGFIAHTESGLPSLLKRYTDIFYEVAFTDSLFLDRGIGDIEKEAGKRYLQRNSDNELNIAQVQQMVLHGDPSLALFGAKLADYEINANNVFTESIDGQPINAFTKLFRLGLIVRNFGSAVTDSLKITVNRKLSNGQNIQLDTLVFAPVLYKDTLYFNIKSAGIDGFGLNKFNISLDPLNDIKELDKINNQTTFEYFVSLGGTTNIYPSNLSLINETNINLVAQSLDLLRKDNTFLFELDTTNLFNSPYRKQMSLQGNGLAKWRVNLFENLPEKDTIVFYWRTKFSDTRPEELDIWNQSSFTFIKNGASGWGMAHFQQFDENDLKNIVANQQSRQWEFEKFETSISVKTFGSLHPDFDHENVELSINNIQYIFPTRLCTDNSMNLMAFDKVTTIPYLVLGNPFILDRKSCGRIPQAINNMLKREIEINLHMEQYIDAVSDGDYVLLFSIGNVTYQSWPASTLAKLGEFGINASDIQNIADGEPVIIIGKKGMDPGSATIIKADYSSPEPANEQEIILNQMISGQAVSGVISSPKIGPAANWSSFHQRISLSELTDIYAIDIYGIDASNNENLLFENIKSNEIDLRGVSISTNPYLRLELKVQDEEYLTPAQLEQWFVIYEGLPDGVLTYKQGQEIRGIEKNEGETHEAAFIFENVTDLAYKDSIKVEYSLFNQNDRKSYTDTIQVKPLNGGESVAFSFSLETLNKSGLNDFKVFANPYIQKEHNFNNNFINFSDYLAINKDNTNPILEVTIDGEFIMDGDIVAPSPLITLRLKDENSALLKEDTLGVNLYLNEKCDNCQSRRISFSSPYVNWTPATEDTDYTLEYQPQTLADGIYTLRAEASDASGNPSGTEPYSVNFEIVNESQITNFFPYPNPFSTRTQFVFTLTGSVIPDQIIIQIMTVSGTVVREITQDEIGPIKIGHNKTEYAWDGHDEYGDQLANGVYLYKVKIFNSGQEMKQRVTSADRAFKHGIGKMYLLR